MFIFGKSTSYHPTPYISYLEGLLYCGETELVEPIEDV